VPGHVPCRQRQARLGDHAQLALVTCAEVAAAVLWFKPSKYSGRLAIQARATLCRTASMRPPAAKRVEAAEPQWHGVEKHSVEWVFEAALQQWLCLAVEQRLGGGSSTHPTTCTRAQT
jgi:hypothetical protein